MVVGDGAQAVYAFTTPITESDAAVAPPVANLEKNLDKFSNAAEKKVVVLDAFPELPTSLSVRRALRRNLSRVLGRRTFRTPQPRVTSSFLRRRVIRAQRPKPSPSRSSPRWIPRHATTG